MIRGRSSRAGGDSAPESALPSRAEEHHQAYEERLKRTIEQLLERSLGPGRVQAEVSAELDLDQVTLTEETFDPEGQVVRSTQTIEEESRSAERDDNEAVSVGNNLPNAADTPPSGRASSDNTTRTEETVNYEISRKVRNQTQVGGRVRRLSVAVLVDGKLVPNEAGEPVYSPRDAEELAQIESLVRSAVGFDAARGDVVEVRNMPFNLRAAAGILVEARLIGPGGRPAGPPLALRLSASHCAGAGAGAAPPAGDPAPGSGVIAGRDASGRLLLRAAGVSLRLETPLSCRSGPGCGSFCRRGWRRLVRLLRPRWPVLSRAICATCSRSLSLICSPAAISARPRSAQSSPSNSASAAVASWTFSASRRVRSGGAPLAAALQSDIRALVEAANEVTGSVGKVAFRAAELLPLPEPRLAPDPQLTA